MTSISTPSKVFGIYFDHSTFVLSETHLKTSQLIQSICDQVRELAPLCGMMLGQLAAPFVRFQSARLFGQILGKEGFSRSISHVGSWICGVSTEGFLMTTTPELIRGELGIGLWKGTVHSTTMMMVCEGISKRVPLKGAILGACGQDVGVMLVNWTCGELGISEKVQGGVIYQWTEARITSMRIGVSTCFTRTMFVDVFCIKTKYELGHQLVKNSVSSSLHKIPLGRAFFNSFREKFTQAINNHQFVTPEGVGLKFEENVIHSISYCKTVEGDGSKSNSQNVTKTKPTAFATLENTVVERGTTEKGELSTRNLEPKDSHFSKTVDESKIRVSIPTALPALIPYRSISQLRHALASREPEGGHDSAHPSYHLWSVQDQVSRLSTTLQLLEVLKTHFPDLYREISLHEIEKGGKSFKTDSGGRISYPHFIEKRYFDRNDAQIVALLKQLEVLGF